MRPNRVIPRYPRETVKFIPITDVTIDGLPVTNPAEVQTAIVPESGRPTAWINSLALDGGIGFKLDGPTLGRGVFTVYARVPRSTEAPVIELGQIRLT